MGLFDSGSEEPRSKLRRYVLSGLALVALVVLTGWYLLRFQAEKKTVARFFDAVAAGDTEKAYGIWKVGKSYKSQSAAEIWKPGQSYSYQDFLEDWGPSGYYGAVKSYRIATAQAAPKGGSGVIVAVEVSPYTAFPDEKDVEKNRKTKEVRIWAERKDQSLSFPP